MQNSIFLPFAISLSAAIYFLCLIKIFFTVNFKCVNTEMLFLVSSFGPLQLCLPKFKCQCQIGNVMDDWERSQARQVTTSTIPSFKSSEILPSFLTLVHMQQKVLSWASFKVRSPLLSFYQNPMSADWIFEWDFYGFSCSVVKKIGSINLKYLSDFKI